MIKTYLIKEATALPPEISTVRTAATNNNWNPEKLTIIASQSKTLSSQSSNRGAYIQIKMQDTSLVGVINSITITNAASWANKSRSTTSAVRIDGIDKTVNTVTKSNSSGSSTSITKAIFSLNSTESENVLNNLKSETGLYIKAIITDPSDGFWYFQYGGSIEIQIDYTPESYKPVLRQDMIIDTNNFYGNEGKITFKNAGFTMPNRSLWPWGKNEFSYTIIFSIKDLTNSKNIIETKKITDVGNDNINYDSIIWDGFKEKSSSSRYEITVQATVEFEKRDAQPSVKTQVSAPYSTVLTGVAVPLSLSQRGWGVGIGEKISLGSNDTESGARFECHYPIVVSNQKNSSNIPPSYGTSLPATGIEGQIFFKLTSTKEGKWTKIEPFIYTP